MGVRLRRLSRCFRRLRAGRATSGGSLTIRTSVETLLLRRAQHGPQWSECVMRSSFVSLLFGPPLPDRMERVERVGPVRGVAVLGLDALASAAYGPEALLTVLIVLGTASAQWVLPLSAVIVVVLVI